MEVGGGIGVLVRVELSQPGLQLRNRFDHRAWRPDEEDDAEARVGARCRELGGQDPVDDRTVLSKRRFAPRTQRPQPLEPLR